MARMWISFSGLDGAGKSTQIALLAAALQRQGLSLAAVTMHDDVSLAARLRGTRRRGRAVAPTPGATPAPPEAKAFRLDKNHRGLFTLLARLALYPADLLSLLMLRRRRDIRAADVVICDRFLFDSLANLLAVHPWTMPYARAFMALMPLPQVAVLLDLDGQVAFERKPEYPLDYMHERRRAYRDLFRHVASACVVDAQQPPALVHEQILAAVQPRMAQIAQAVGVTPMMKGSL